MYRIMLIDDEVNILTSIKRLLKRKKDWEVESFTDPHEAIRRAQTTPFEMFLSDYRMPLMNGVELLEELKKHQPEAIRLILSGYTDLEALLGAINEAEIFRFISKPWEDYELISTMELALEHREMLVENRRLADQVRRQQQELDNRKTALDSFHDKHPELFEVNWGEDGSIII